jgi:AraC-like DNA-binding protein
MALFNWYPVYIPLSILIYWLGIKGYLVSQTRSENGKSKKLPFQDKILGEEVMIRLRKVMKEEKLWINPSLNLSMLAQHTGIPSKTISAVLNQHLNKSFNEFINGYRIDAIKARLLSAADKNLTIAGLAYECGFNSQPTFQRAFKSIQGESPSEFLIKHTDSGKELA